MRACRALCAWSIVSFVAVVGFVGFDDLAFAAERAGRGNVVFHRFADAVKHEPSGFVGDAKRAVKLMAREPFLEAFKR